MQQQSKPANEGSITDFYDLVEITRAVPMNSFNELIIDYLSDVSALLFKSAKSFPDVITFAFWCRKANLIKLANCSDPSLRKGRGIIFHITPSNIPVNFAYSAVAGLVTGNINLVRVPSRDFEQVRLVVEAFREVLSNTKYLSLKPFLNFIRYGRNEKITSELSQLCDIRIIWGGDRSIQEIRKYHLKASAFDVVFADRYSLSILNAERYLDYDRKDQLAKDFYNDTYLFDQNACTSPRSVFWIGSDEKVKLAREQFWKSVHDLCTKNYTIQALQSIDKLVSEQRMAIEFDDVTHVETTDNLINRVELKKPLLGLENYTSTGGLFTEFCLSHLAQVFQFTSRKYQTLSYFGFEKEELFNLIENNQFYGIDRVVPIGKTMDFSMNWDGYELGRILTKKIELI